MRTTMLMLMAALLLGGCGGEDEVTTQPEPVAEPPVPTMASCRRNQGSTCIEIDADEIARRGWESVQSSCTSSYEQIVPDQPCPSENRVGGCGEPGGSPNWYYAPSYTVASAQEACVQMQGLGCPRCAFVSP